MALFDQIDFIGTVSLNGLKEATGDLTISQHTLTRYRNFLEDSLENKTGMRFNISISLEGGLQLTAISERALAHPISEIEQFAGEALVEFLRSDSFRQQ